MITYNFQRWYANSPTGGRLWSCSRSKKEFASYKSQCYLSEEELIEVLKGLIRENKLIGGTYQVKQISDGDIKVIINEVDMGWAI